MYVDIKGQADIQPIAKQPAPRSSWEGADLVSLIH